jgi:PAS domain S-box-containing protein
MGKQEGLSVPDDSLNRSAERVVTLSPDEFRNLPAGEAQRLLGDMLRRTVGLEAQVRQLQEVGQRAEELRKQCIDLYDYAPVGYFVVDNHTAVVDVNFTACDMLCCPKDSLLTKPFMSLVEPRCIEALRAYFKEISETGNRLGCEVEMTRGDGTTMHAELRTVSLYDKSVIAFRISMSDITACKRAEAALMDSEQRFKELADLCPEPIFETDLSGKATYVNAKAQAAFGVANGDLARGISIFEYVLPEQRAMAMQRFKQVLEQGDIGAVEYTLVRGDGVRFPCLVHSAPIVREGSVKGVRGVVVDISQRG